MGAAGAESLGWVLQEDEACRGDRAKRLEWVTTLLPPDGTLLFPGGLLSHFLFEETRYCFIYGQFLAAAILGCALVERLLAARLYGSGDDAMERARIATLLDQAKERSWLTESELQALDRARRLRNALAHFRAPGHEDGIEWRAADSGASPYDVLEGDAREVVAAAVTLLIRSAV